MRLRLATAFAALALAAAGCANGTSPGSSGTGAGTIVHPTGPDQLVLRVEDSGGFVAPTYLFTRLAGFSLFGDGTLLQPGAQIEIYPGPALPAISAQTISEDGLQAILRAALTAGLDHDASYTDLGSMGIADASATVFTLTVDGRTHRIEAYALGMEGEERPAGMPVGEWEARRALQAFVTQIGDLASWLPPGSIAGAAAYESTAARLLVGPYAPDDQLPQHPEEWPLAAPLTSFGEPTAFDAGTTCGVVDGGDWTTVQALARQANDLTPWVSDGHRYAIDFRPLLPDEHSC